MAFQHLVQKTYPAKRPKVLLIRLVLSAQPTKRKNIMVHAYLTTITLFCDFLLLCRGLKCQFEPPGAEKKAKKKKKNFG